MIQKIDHIGIAVRDIDAAFRFFTEVLGLAAGPREEINGIKIAFVRAGSRGSRGSRIAFAEPASAHGVLMEFCEHPKAS